jgi:seryl-tRNA synthetase
MAKAQAKKRPPRTIERELSIADAVSEAHGELETLGQELRDWYDNLHENLQGSRDDINDAADTLENMSEPDVPEGIGKHTWKFSALARKARSRSDRRDEATGTLDATIQELERMSEDPEHAADKEAIDQLVEDLNSYKEEAEGVDFPGRNA